MTQSAGNKSIIFTQRCCDCYIRTQRLMPCLERLGVAAQPPPKDFSKRAVSFVAKSGQHDHDRSANRGTHAMCSVLSREHRSKKHEEQVEMMTSSSQSEAGNVAKTLDIT